MSHDPAPRAPLLNFNFRCDRTVLMPSESGGYFIRRDEVAMHLIERGRFRVIFASGDRFELGPRRLMVSWGVMPHRVEWLDPQTTVCCLNLPLSWVLRWQLPAAFIRSLLACQALVEAIPSEGEHDEHMLQRWVKLLRQADDVNRRVVLLEAEARLLRFARGHTTASRPKTASRSTKVEETIELIAEKFAEPLSVPALAEALDIHPNYLSTLFKRETGQTLSHYLIDYRLAHASALLVGTTDKIIDVAMSAGFGSVSQFHAVFRQHRGCSPRQYRLTHRPPDPYRVPTA